MSLSGNTTGRRRIEWKNNKDVHVYGMETSLWKKVDQPCICCCCCYCFVMDKLTKTLIADPQYPFINSRVGMDEGRWRHSFMGIPPGVRRRIASRTLYSSSNSERRLRCQSVTSYGAREQPYPSQIVTWSQLIGLPSEGQSHQCCWRHYCSWMTRIRSRHRGACLACCLCYWRHCHHLHHLPTSRDVAWFPPGSACLPPWPSSICLSSPWPLHK